jgi:3'(2'), 5'-bisphosphate nucleotidase
MLFGSEHADAARIAAEAGELLLDLRRRLADEGVDLKTLRDAGDRRSNELILRRLRETYPDDPVLSEESKDDPARLASRRVWIVDPLDGTREFGEAGRTDWAVHVACALDGMPVVGAVALPASGLVLSTSPAPTVPPPAEGQPRLLVSRSRPPSLALELARRLGALLVPMGSAGAKTMAVVLGEGDVYVHAGGQYEWDSCAPIAVAAAAGLHVSRLDGSPLRYNQPSPWLPDQVVCRAELADRVLRELAQIGEPEK